MKQKPSTKTSAPAVDNVASVQQADPIATRLDKIIELLTSIQSQVPKPFDLSKLIKD